MLLDVFYTEWVASVRLPHAAFLDTHIEGPTQAYYAAVAQHEQGAGISVIRIFHLERVHTLNTLFTSAPHCIFLLHNPSPEVGIDLSSIQNLSISGSPIVFSTPLATELSIFESLFCIFENSSRVAG